MAGSQSLGHARIIRTLTVTISLPTAFRPYQRYTKERRSRVRRLFDSAPSCLIEIEGRKECFLGDKLSWQGIPCFTVEEAACSLLVDTAPLFEEKGDSSPSTLISDFNHPFFRLLVLPLGPTRLRQ